MDELKNRRPKYKCFVSYSIFHYSKNSDQLQTDKNINRIMFERFVSMNYQLKSRDKILYIEQSKIIPLHD